MSSLEKPVSNDALKESLSSYWGNPPNFFRSVPVFPEEWEIFVKDCVYHIEKLKNGKFNSVEHYIFCHFRLLRETLRRHFQRQIFDYRSMNSRSAEKQPSSNRYQKIKLTGETYGPHGRRFSLSVTTEKEIDWEMTKGLLPGSLLCVSPDMFSGNFCFVSLQDRKPTYGRSKSCSLEVMIECKRDNFFDVCTSRTYDMVEAQPFYESYRECMIKLKYFNKEVFPLRANIDFLVKREEKLPYSANNVTKSILQHAEEAVQSTANIQYEANCSISLGEFSNERHFYNEPSHLNFQTEQERAFRLALSNKVVLIDGFPGTGKTHLGVQIVQHLIIKKLVETPIVIMCNTTAVLDHFLQGVLEITENIIRIAGQTKNSALDSYELQTIIETLRKLVFPIKKKDFLRVNAEQSVSEEKRKIYKILRKLADFKTVNGAVFSMNELNQSISEINQKMMELKETINLSKTFPILDKGKKLLDLFLRFPDRFKGVFKILKESVSDCQFLKTADSRVLDKISFTLKIWLCLTDASNCKYLGFPEFNCCVIEEVLREIDESKFSDDGIDTEIRPKLTHSVKSNDFGKTLAFICSPGIILSINRDNFSEKGQYILSRKNASKKIQSYVNAYLTDDDTAFPILERALLRYKKKITVEENSECNIWQLGIVGRWELFHEWRKEAINIWEEDAKQLMMMYKEKIKMLKEDTATVAVAYAEKADVIGITVTSALKNWEIIEKVRARVVLVEEAKEIAETQLVASLASTTEQLILIGDRFQSGTKHFIHKLAKDFGMQNILSNRLCANGVPSLRLRVQHRMKPSIEELMVPDFHRRAYTCQSNFMYESIKGVAEDVFFVNHQQSGEAYNDTGVSVNKYEAEFLSHFYFYLLQQGYTGEQITILTMTISQKLLFETIFKSMNIQNSHVTVVEDFRGLENDIILLSFVESKQNTETQFLVTEDVTRIALTRAKKGLYCIGNFDILSSRLLLWKRITGNLAQRQRIGKKLPLRCQNHPYKVTKVVLVKDFDKVKHGGCDEVCSRKHFCGHTCKQQCHVSNAYYDNFECKSICSLLQCNNSHLCYLCPVTGSLKTKISSKKNRSRPEKILSSTDVIAETEYPFSDNRSIVKKLVTEKESISVALTSENVHDARNISEVCCHATHAPKEAACTVEVEKILPCGHVATLPCSQKLCSYTCKENVLLELPCGHLQLVPCFLRQELDAVPCKYSAVTVMECKSMSWNSWAKEFRNKNCHRKVKHLCGDLSEIHISGCKCCP